MSEPRTTSLGTSLPDTSLPDTRLADTGLPDTGPQGDWRADIVRFWFRDLTPRDWFTRSDATDARIVGRFADLPALVANHPVDALVTSAKDALAAVIALDQFPRNMFRGTPRSFAFDGHALAVARRTIALGYDRLLRKDERLFLYLPFEHAEDTAMQARSVELTARLGNTEWTKYAIAHKVIVDRFGRFPHRNAILGRLSTPEETAFLQTPGSSF